MPPLSKYLTGMWCRVGFLAVGAVLFILNLTNCISSYMYPLSCFMVGSGIVIVLYGLKRPEDRDNNPNPDPVSGADPDPVSGADPESDPDPVSDPDPDSDPDPVSDPDAVSVSGPVPFPDSELLTDSNPNSDPDHDARMEEFYKRVPHIELEMQDMTNRHLEYQQSRKMMFVASDIARATRNYCESNQRRNNFDDEQREALVESESIASDTPEENTDDSLQLERQSHSS